jgi:methionyl-tRNA synthetase
MLEALYIIAHYIAPIIPNTADKIFNMLNTKPILLFNMNMDFYNLVPGTKVSIGDILFEKLVYQDEFV